MSTPIPAHPNSVAATTNIIHVMNSRHAHIGRQSFHLRDAQKTTRPCSGVRRHFNLTFLEFDMETKYGFVSRRPFLLGDAIQLLEKCQEANNPTQSTPGLMALSSKNRFNNAAITTSFGALRRTCQKRVHWFQRGSMVKTQSGFYPPEPCCYYPGTCVDHLTPHGRPGSALSGGRFDRLPQVSFRVIAVVFMNISGATSVLRTDQRSHW